MKILIIPSWHPTPEKPLWCTWVLPHIAALREAGHDVYVLQVDIELTKDLSKLDEKEIIKRNEKHIFASLPIKYHKYYRTRFFYGSILNAYSEKIHVLYKKVEKEWGKPDVIHAHVSLPAGYGAAELGVKEQIPVVVTEHYSGFENDAKFWWRVGVYIKKMGKKIQGFYTVSPGNLERINNTSLIKVTSVLNNPIDTLLFSPKEKKLDTGKFEIVTSGGLSSIKGIDILFDALLEIGDKINWHLTLFGGLENQIKYKNWLDNPILSKRIVLKGKVSQDELVIQYSKSDIYIVSSRIETANVSMLEAMSCGCAIITTKIGAPETLINKNVGMSIPAEDSKAMANSIILMSNTIKNYKREELREFVVKNYSKDVTVNKMIEAYTIAINSCKTTVK